MHKYMTKNHITITIVLKRLKSFGDDPKDSKFIRQVFNKGVK